MFNRKKKQLAVEEVSFTKSKKLFLNKNLNVVILNDDCCFKNASEVLKTNPLQMDFL